MLALSIGLLSGCPQRSEVWIAPGSSANNLVLVVAHTKGGDKPVSIGYFRIVRCELPVDVRSDSASWDLDNVGSGHPILFIYGKPPMGFRTISGPKALIPGCYRVVLSGNARFKFEVRPDGSVAAIE
jgi:hypothetical protein